MTMHRSPNALPWLLLSVLVIALDQWTKHIVLGALDHLERVEVIPGLLNWTLAFNPGAAFSFLANESGWQRWLFTALAIGVSAVLVVWLGLTRRNDWLTALPLALIVGGAVGNLIDRVRHGHVTDFIQVFHGDWYFPAFNVADSAISVGAVLLILSGFISGKDAKGEG